MELNLRKGSYDAPSVLAGLVAGLAIGGGAAWLVCDRALTRRFEDRLDQEVADLKTRYNDRLKEALSDAISFVPEAGAPFVGRPDDSLHLAGDEREDEAEGRSTLADADDADDGEYGELHASDLRVDSFRITDPLEGLEDGEEDADEEDDGADQAAAPAVDRNIDHPYLISLEEFSESPPGWQALTLKYFAGDRTPVLVDDKEEPIPHYHKIVGKIRGKQDFGGISGDPHIRYVRNQQHETDYEIVYDPRSYAEGVLNYGQPNRGS